VLAKEPQRCFSLASAARAEALRVLALDPKYIPALSVLSGAAVLIGQYLPDAESRRDLLQTHEILLAAKPDGPLPARFLNHWGQLLTQLANVSAPDDRDHFYEQSAKLFQEAVTKGGDAGAHLINLASAFTMWAIYGDKEHTAERFQRAEECLQESQRISPTNFAEAELVELKALRALLLPKMIDEAAFAAAEQGLLALSEKDPTGPAAHICLARMYVLRADRCKDGRADEFRRLAAEHKAQAEQLSPGISRGHLRRYAQRSSHPPMIKIDKASPPPKST
jgi:tetratricopeptide (TPR) repeat protein